MPMGSPTPNTMKRRGLLLSNIASAAALQLAARMRRQGPGRPPLRGLGGGRRRCPGRAHAQAQARLPSRTLPVRMARIALEESHMLDPDCPLVDRHVCVITLAHACAPAACQARPYRLLYGNVAAAQRCGQARFQQHVKQVHPLRQPSPK